MGNDDEEFEEEEPMMDLEGLRKLNQSKVRLWVTRYSIKGSNSSILIFAKIKIEELLLLNLYLNEIKTPWQLKSG